MKSTFILFLFVAALAGQAQENPLNNPVQTHTQLKVNELVEKKAEYHRMTAGQKDGYRIKIYLGVDRDGAETMKTKCNTLFPDLPTQIDYQQPNFVVLVGDYRTKLQAFEAKKQIQADFPSSFIVKSKINVK